MNSCEVNLIMKIIKENADNQYEDFTAACQNNPTYKKAAEICSKYGYRVARDCYVEVYPSGKEYVNFGIMHPGSDSDLPEVYYYGYGNRADFRIQTTSVGSLLVDAHSKWIEAQVAANKMVKDLEQLDLTTLYRLERNE